MRPLPSRLWLSAALVFLAVLLCYSNHFENRFQFDDSHTVTDNLYIRSLKNIPRFFTDASTFSTLPANRTWRPLVSTSLAVDYWLAGGLKPLWFHVSTFFWYLVQLAVMFALYRRILHFAGGEWWVDYCALFAAAWYGLHPAMAETVNYIIQRGDLYSTLGVTASLAIFAMFPKGRKTGLYLLPAALGVLAKPPAAIFPAILLGYVFLFEENAEPRRLGAALKQCWPAFVAMLPLLVLESKMTPPTYVAGIVSAHNYIVTQPYVALHYFLSFFLPVGLTADTDLTAFPTLFTTDGLVGLGFLAALAWGICFTARDRRRRPISFGLLWFLLGLLPTALFPLSEVENDHRMFLPFVGLALAAAWTLALVMEARARVRPAIIAAGAVLLLAAYGQGAWQRNRVWSTEETLWKDVTIKSPRNGRGLMNYGLALMAKGQTAEALGDFEQALRFDPDYNVLEINLGIANGALGRDREAESHFQRAIQLIPSDALADYYYGRWLHQKRRIPEAIALLQSSIAKNPEYLPPRDELLQAFADAGLGGQAKALAADTLRIAPGDAAALIAQKMPAPAAAPAAEGGPVAAAEALAQRDPTPENYLELSLAYDRAGRFQDCIRAARQALKLRPDYAEAWNNIAAGYEALADWDEAIQAAEIAVKLKPDFQLAKNNLAYSIEQKRRSPGTGK